MSVEFTSALEFTFSSQRKEQAMKFLENSRTYELINVFFIFFVLC